MYETGRNQRRICRGQRGCHSSTELHTRVVALVYALVPSALAGSLDPPAGPALLPPFTSAAGAGAVTTPVARLAFESRPELKLKVVRKPVVGFVAEPVASFEHRFKPVLTIRAGVPVSLVDGNLGVGGDLDIGGGLDSFGTSLGYFSSYDSSNSLDYKR
ncbi:uncharacterized protein LOC144155102 [Haemaphysalis longicornis]